MAMSKRTTDTPKLHQLHPRDEPRILNLSKDFAKQICGELADSGREAEVNSMLRDYMGYPSANMEEMCQDALGDLGTARQLELKRVLGGLGRSMK